MASTKGKLTLADISDLRAYERERADFRTRVIALKKRRRIPVGPIVTLVFENRDTIRFQIQEMARVEKLITDDAIQGELDTYNTLIPEAGQLCATVFIELTEDVQLREWLPRLVGIERSIGLRVGTGPDALLLRATPEAAHEQQLTRDEITASVHYVFWDLAPEQVAAVSSGPVALVIDHLAYSEETELGPETLEELRADLAG
jgi:hypothetical protein